VTTCATRPSSLRAYATWCCIGRVAATRGFGFAGGAGTGVRVIAMPLPRDLATVRFRCTDGVDSRLERDRDSGTTPPGARVDVDVLRATAGSSTRPRVRHGGGLQANGSVAWRELLLHGALAGSAASGGGRPPARQGARTRRCSATPVTLRTAWDYARVSSDYNPIHLHDGAARKFRLRGVIMHGMWSLAWPRAGAARCWLREASSARSSDARTVAGE
jgi:hypothetical protein